MSQALKFSGCLGGAKTYATWNPADKSSNLTLSNGDLTASGPAATWACGRATVGKSSGKWYWEIHWDTSTTNYLMVGVGNSSASVASGSYPGFDANGYGYLCSLDGHKYNNGDQGAYGATCVQGDTIGVALDMDAGTIVMYKNGVSQGTMFSGLSGTIYPMIGAGADAATLTITANFGASAFSYSVPSGFNSGIYS
jgi:hypothetical protein